MVSARAIRAGRANVELGLDDSEFQRRLRGIGKDLQSVGRNLAIGGAALAGFGASILGPLAKATQLAGDFAETVNRFEAVFGAQADATDAWATDLANAVGRSKSEILDALSSFQGFFVGLGFGAEQAAEFSKQMQSLSVDFASFNNLSDQEATERFISALSGSSEVLDKFGINIKQAALEQELLSQGIRKSWTEVTEQEKAVARMSVIMRSMTDQGAVGDAVKTSGSFANQLKALKAALTDTAIAIGTELLPVATQLVSRAKEILQPLAMWVKENGTLVVGIGKLGAAALAIGAPLAALGVTANAVGSGFVVLSKSAPLAAGAMRAMTAAMGPLGAALSALSLAFAIGEISGLNDELRAFLGLTDKAKNRESGVGQNPYDDTPGTRPGNETRAALNKFSTEVTGPLPRQRQPVSPEEFRRIRGEIEAGAKERAAARGQGDSKAGGPNLLDVASNIGNNLKLEFDIKKSQTSRGLELGKEWAIQFWDTMEDERLRRDDLMEQIAAQQDTVANQEQAIASARDNANLITGSAAAGVAGLGTKSVDERMLEELEKQNKELERLRKELNGDS